MHNILYTYRIFCNTENQWVYKNEDSNVTVNAVCFNNSNHSIDPSSFKIIHSEYSNGVFVENIPITAFSELRTTTRTPVLELKSSYGRSNYRDIYIETGSGSITNLIGDGFFNLSVTDANDRVVVRSKERVKYKAGFVSESGVSVRLNPTNPIGNQIGKFGLYDDDYGFYFKYSSIGLSVVILTEGVETVVPRDYWNYDKLDGTGPSKHILDLSLNTIFKFVYSLQGSGSIQFLVNCVNITTGFQGSFLTHTFISNETTFIKQPNIPITVELDNAGTAGERNIELAGRQGSIVGKYSLFYRNICEYNTNVAVVSTTFFTPILSIRRKPGYEGLPISISSFDIIASENLFIEMRFGSTLTGANFGNLTDYDPEDTGMETDTSATSMIDGTPVFCKLITGENKSTTVISSDIGTTLNGLEILTISAKGVTSAGTVTAAILRWVEEW